jgi:exodeoxyribonuclease V beta subunit
MPDFTTRIADLSDTSLSPPAINRLHLMEAHAGTGKTYSIQTIYLRLVLIEGLSVQQILTVTFTKDATKELRDRLQHVLRSALDYLENPETLTDPRDRTRVIVDLATDHAGAATARQRLRMALLDFDMAAIYTIHGFCQRVLQRFAFETRQGFDVEPASSTDEEIDLICKDWWRTNTYSMDNGNAAILAESGVFSLASISRLAHKLIAKPDAILDGASTRHDALPSWFGSKLVDFIHNHPPAPAETSDYPAAPEDLKEAVIALQAYLRAGRSHAAAGQLDLSLEAILKAIRFTRTVTVSGRSEAATLKHACERFMEHIPKGTQTRTFSLDGDNCLRNDRCPTLTQDHTRAIQQAAAAFDLHAVAAQYQPLSIRKNAAFDHYSIVINHFRATATATASDLVKAIKGIAESGCGIVEKVTCTVDAINPEIKRLHNGLLADCQLAVYQAATEIKADYQGRRASARAASFNDYLINLRAALQHGEALQKVLRNEFQAALIDEFQDTDPIQWGIFEKLFRNAGIPCFLVGDPKQAIYRFRNGDVETYLQATEYVDNAARYPLEKNYRSEKRLIDAINQVFMDTADQQTFGEGISYNRPLDAAGKKLADSLLVNGQPDTRPCKLLLMENKSPTGRLPGRHSPTARQAYKLTAQEIARLLRNQDLSRDGKPLEAGDIAVLVNRHQESEYIAEELRRLNIPAVRQGTGDVWKTDEARNLWAMFEAVLDARNPYLVRNALITAWGGVSIDQLQALNDGMQVVPPYAQDADTPYGMEHFVELFDDLHAIWQKRGYPSMFRKLTSVFALKQRLLANADNQGQRRLTNIAQLSEIIEREIIKDRKTPEGILAWIRRQCGSETPEGGEENNLRLETDDDAVRIMTIFTSKGLQFPIVFAPTLFMMEVQQKGGTYEYHDAQGKLHIATRADSPTMESTPKEREKEEMGREHVRQIYVALTRAIHRTVVIALNDGKQSGSLGRLLQLPLVPMAEAGDSTTAAIAALQQRFENIPGVACAVEASLVGEPDDIPPFDARVKVPIMEAPPQRPAVEISRNHGSFSSLTPHEDRDTSPQAVLATADDPRNRDGETLQTGETAPTIPPQGIFAFPSGAKTGICWHAIFEDVDFKADENGIRDVVEEKLGIHGFLKRDTLREERIRVTVDMVRHVLQTRLPQPPHDATKTPFAFSDIARRDRKTEWEFSFAALPGKRTQALQETIARHAPYKQFTDALGIWDKQIPGGYLTGFVDLLFRQDDRYYIADWKSNRRNGQPADFCPVGLIDEMSRHRYWLQYLIYTVAVHQYLATAMPGYNYTDHFGGVYYIFLRGVDGQMLNGQPNGIYHDRPPLQLIEELSSILGDFT